MVVFQDMVVALKQWEAKVDRHWDEGAKIVPVHLRTGGVKEATPARAIVDYETSEVRLYTVYHFQWFQIVWYFWVTIKDKTYAYLKLHTKIEI